MSSSIFGKRIVRVALTWENYFSSQYNQRFKINEPFQCDGRKGFWGTRDVTTENPDNRTVIHTEQRVLGKWLK